MSTNVKILSVALVCILIAGGIYAYAYWKEDTAKTQTASSTAPMSKVPAATIDDGTYTVQIHSIRTSPEDTIIQFAHVTYFEGDEAMASAKHDVQCKDHPIESCVPSLTRNYYVRVSGAADFNAPVTAKTTITLKDKDTATVNDLNSLTRDMNPVFDVVIKDGNIDSITEKSPLGSTKS